MTDYAHQNAHYLGVIDGIARLEKSIQCKRDFCRRTNRIHFGSSDMGLVRSGNKERLFGGNHGGGGFSPEDGGGGAARPLWRPAAAVRGSSVSVVRRLCIGRPRPVRPSDAALPT